MDSFFRRDVLQQETDSFLHNCLTLPTYQKLRYKFPTFDENNIRRALFYSNNFKVNLPVHADKTIMNELFLRGCFNKCRQYVLHKTVDYDEIDCTIKCSSKSAQSYEILKSLAVPTNFNN